MNRLVIMIVALALSSCAGISGQIEQYEGKGITALKEAAEVVEFSRCSLRTVAVLEQMAQERGADWTRGYFASCPNLKSFGAKP